jgi:hypothetical protein
MSDVRHSHYRSICDSLIRPADWDSNEFLSKSQRPRYDITPKIGFL